MGAERLVLELAAARIGATFNFYREGEGAADRRRRLVEYLRSRADARILLVGEAAGYRGARVSGIPFTSQRQLTDEPPGELGLVDEVLLWNVVPTHPHRPGRPASNRRPTRAEIEAPVGRVAHPLLGGPYVRHPSHGGSAAFRTALADYPSR